MRNLHLLLAVALLTIAVVTAILAPSMAPSFPQQIAAEEAVAVAPATITPVVAVSHPAPLRVPDVVFFVIAVLVLVGTALGAFFFPDGPAWIVWK